MHALAWPFPLCFDPDRAKKREKRVRSSVADQPKREARLLCAACRHLVTYPIHRLSVHGSHEHTCTNPLGVRYSIGCFREANGCAATDPTNREFSWFPGYVWRVGICTACRTHLGWRFDAPEDHFYGLILDRLVLDQQGETPGGAP